MTPIEKANELIKKFSERRKILTETKGWVEYINSSMAKTHALVAVDEILNINSVDKDFSLSFYWQEVKQEIENL